MKLKTDFLATFWQPNLLTSRIRWRDYHHFTACRVKPKNQKKEVSEM